MTKTSAEKPHSAEYFGEQRNFWWNLDFLELQAHRWRLRDVHLALDAGSGIGHWGRLLLPFLAKDGSIIGVDREPEWVLKAGETAHRLGLASRLTYKQGDVTALPFADESFDLVTCQTLLIHVRDIRQVISEFLRVLRPGGLLALAEPNNLATALLHTNTNVQSTIEDRITLIRFQAVCERGKDALGKGNNSVGDLLPGLLAELGVSDVRAHFCDRIIPLFPPYDREEQRVMIAQTSEWAERDFWIWDRAETREYFLAGGGSADEFEALWKRAIDAQKREMNAARDHRLTGIAAGILLLVSGRKASHRGQPDAWETHRP